MERFEHLRIKWTYVTHAVDRSVAVALLPPVPEERPGALLLARVAVIGKHTGLESADGRKAALFPGDVFVGALGERYATDQYEGRAVCSGTVGHVLGVGGVCGEVVSRNLRMPDPTTIEWIGRLADETGRPLGLGDFRRRPAPAPRASRPRTIVSVGASMNSGKTTTAAQVVRSLAGRGLRVSAGKITGTACRRDPSLLEDAGADVVLDFSHFGHASTAGVSRDALLGLAADLHDALLETGPDFVVYEIADGIFQRETRMLLEAAAFRSTVDAVTFAGPDALSCESGVRHLRELELPVVAVAGPVANAPLGIAEVERATGLPCLSGEMILGGALIQSLGLPRAA